MFAKHNNNINNIIDKKSDGTWINRTNHQPQKVNVIWDARIEDNRVPKQVKKWQPARGRNEKRNGCSFIIAVSVTTEKKTVDSKLLWSFRAK